MTEADKLSTTKIHIKLKNSFVKHGKKLGTHIQKHHKKYTFGATMYAIVHIAIVKILALKLLVFKVGLGILALFGIYESPMLDTFAEIENICIANKPIIAQQKCEKNFASIEDAVSYIESKVDPETDTIYNAGHYTIISSMLREYCKTKISKDILKSQVTTFQSIYKIKDSKKKIAYTKTLYNQGKRIVATNDFLGKNNFCTTKYNGYNMLSIAQKEFLKEFKKQGLLNIASLSGINNNKSDLFILSTFYNKDDSNKQSKIPFTIGQYKDIYTKSLAETIKTRTLSFTENTIDELQEKTILTKTEASLIVDKLSIAFVPGCDKNTGIHSLNEYYNNKNVLIDTKLEKIQLNVHLCKSYQYIDELEINIPKLLIHEIGHYVYSFKDKTADRFENICRRKNGDKQYNKCSNDAFITKYSKTNAEEDYAETFSRWGLKVINNDIDTTKNISTEMEVNRHGSAPLITLPSSITTSIIDKKFNYFDTFLQQTKKMVLGFK